MGGNPDFGAIEVSGNDRGGAPGDNTAPTIKRGTGGSGGSYVDPYAGMSCYEIYLEAFIKTCGYVEDEADCDENLVPVAGPAIPLCTVVTPTDPAEIAARQAALARQYALDYFKSLPLPVPQPTMSATEGTTGAVHQLDLRIPRQVRFQDPGTPFGTLNITCYATFNVNWGDGTKNSYTVSGAPYPNSPITHSWTTRGTYDIVVTGQWSADWSFGPYSGSLSGLNTSGTLPDFQVGDLQAVITR